MLRSNPNKMNHFLLCPHFLISASAAPSPPFAKSLSASVAQALLLAVSALMPTLVVILSHAPDRAGAHNPRPSEPRTPNHSADSAD